MGKIIYAADLPKGFIFGTKTRIVVGTGGLKKNGNLIQNNTIVQEGKE